MESKMGGKGGALRCHLGGQRKIAFLQPFSVSFRFYFSTPLLWCSPCSPSWEGMGGVLFAGWWLSCHFLSGPYERESLHSLPFTWKGDLSVYRWQQCLSCGMGQYKVLTFASSSWDVTPSSWSSPRGRCIPVIQLSDDALWTILTDNSVFPGWSMLTRWFKVGLVYSRKLPKASPVLGTGRI